MWWLLRAMCFVHVFGNIFCLLKYKPNNPEANMNATEIASYWGYQWEVHEVVTEDGYILPLFRIPHGKNDSSNSAPKPVVFLQHGLTLSASVWLLNLPNNSLGFLLADAGFDVWLGNSRGNNYARKHLSLDPESKEFWAFSYDEQIKYDIPACTDFIVKKTGQKEVYYVGHSQGVLLAYGAFGTNPQLAEKIKIVFQLGSVVTVKYLTGGFRTVAYLGPTMVKMILGEKDTLRWSKDENVFQILCHRETIATACNNVLPLLFGYNPQNLNESRFDVYTRHIPAGTSVQTILHFSQGIRTGVFQAYDWGSPSLNMVHYNQTTPPLYKIENMKVPTAMRSGGRDILGNPIDVKNLEDKTPNVIFHKKIPDYNHVDFILGKNVREYIYNEIIAQIKKDQSG